MTAPFPNPTGAPLQGNGLGSGAARFFRPPSLVARLTLFVGLTLAALIAVLLAAGFYFGREVLRKAIDAHLSSVASSRQDMVLAHLSQLKQRAELLADHGEFRGLFHNLKAGRPDTINRPYSQGRLDALTDHRTIFSASLADWTGHVLLVNNGAEAGGELASDPAFTNGLAGPYVGLPRAVGNHFEVVLAAPIRDYETPPKNIAVLIVTADISPLAVAVRDTTGLGQTGEVLIGIREGDHARTLFPLRHREQTMAIPLENEPAMAAALEGREFLGTTRDYRGERVLAASQPVGYGGWGLVTKMDAREANAPIARALRYILFGGGIVAAVGLLAAYLLARGIARPIQRLAQAASRVADGDYDTPVPVQSADEFGVLSARFNDMTDALRSRCAERDAKEEALRGSELRLKAIGDHLPGSTIYEYGIRPDGADFFVYLSAGIERSTTYQPEELLAHPEKVYENVFADDLTEMMRATHESARNLTVFDQQVRRRMPNGEIRWFHSRSMPRRLDDGSTVWDGVELDVTDHKRAEEALRRSEERLRQVMDLVPHFIFAKDTDGRFIFANRALAQVFGMTPEELVGRCDSDLSPDEKEAAHFRSDDREVIRTGRPKFISEEPHTDASGRARVLQTTKVPFALPGAAKPGVLGVSVDITERKQAEEARRKLEGELAQARKLEALGTLAGGIAHDFNNLLTAIFGYTQFAYESIPPDHPARSDLDEVIKTSERARDLVQQILTFSRKRAFERKPIKLAPVINDAIRFLRATVPAFVELRCEIAEKNALVLADGSQIHQAIVNLGSNAAHAIGDQPGSILVRLDRVEVGPTVGTEPQLREGAYLCISVSDTGPGIDADKLERVFDPFFTTKEPGKGTGLGLAVVHGVAQSHHGTATVENTPGSGATFRLFFPVMPAGAVEEKMGDAPVLAPGHGHILLIDDEMSVLTVGKKMLETLGYQVTACCGPIKALEVLRGRATAFDLVITDLRMPKMTGLDVAAEIREIRADLPVVLVTGFLGDESIEARAHALGVRAFVSKPFTTETLGQAVHAALVRTQPSKCAAHAET